jgi:hypothetical protein
MRWWWWWWCSIKTGQICSAWMITVQSEAVGKDSEELFQSVLDWTIANRWTIDGTAFSSVCAARMFHMWQVSRTLLRWRRIQG